MICSRNVALSVVALSGIAYLAILRRKQASKNEKAVISQLPDDLLISIIKYMPTKDVVKTSILAKQWRNLYTFTPQINFDCVNTFGVGPHYHDDCRQLVDHLNIYAADPYHIRLGLRKKFIKGVDKFLHPSSGCSRKIISCELSCCFTEFLEKNKLEGWIRSVGRLGVEQLTLKFKCYTMYLEWPYEGKITPEFSCQLISEAPSLQFLSMNWCTLQPNLKSSCNSLKVLHLRWVDINDAAMKCILVNCCNLESLEMVECNVGSKLCISGPNLQLKDIRINACVVEEIEVYADNLVRFVYTNLLRLPLVVEQFSFHHVPQLESLAIKMDGQKLMWLIYGETRRLTLPWPRSSTFNNWEMHKPTGINMFNNLRRLDLHFNVLNEDLSIAPVLDLCPMLEELNLKFSHCVKCITDMVVQSYRRFDDGKVKGEYVRLHTRLKKVSLYGFTGRIREMEFALYILRSTVALERMRLDCFHVCNVIGTSSWIRWTAPKLYLDSKTV